MTDPLVAIAKHAKKGDALLLRLKSARERGEIAQLVCNLRQWHHELYPLAEAYSVPLAESLRQQDPRPEEYARVADREYIGAAQPRLLMTTATALYRLKPHLAAVRLRKPPGRKPGQGAYDDSAAIEEMRRLVLEEGLTPWAAAWRANHLGGPATTTDQKVKRIYDKYRKKYVSN